MSPITLHTNESRSIAGHMIRILEAKPPTGKHVGLVVYPACWVRSFLAHTGEDECTLAEIDTHYRNTRYGEMKYETV